MFSVILTPKESKEEEGPPDESGTNPAKLNRELDNLAPDVQTAKDRAQSLELNMELNQLSSSVKAAREKTQNLLNELSLEAPVKGTEESVAQEARGRHI